MSNLLNLPPIPLGATISLATGCDWLDAFYVSAPGSGLPFTLSGALVKNSTVFTVASVGAAATDMLVGGPGAPDGATVQVISGGAITLSGNSTITAPGATLTFTPPPLDLSGITFSSKIRPHVASSFVLLDCSTAAGTMTAGDTSGRFGWSVPAAQLAAAPWPAQLASQGVLSCVLDVLATDATGVLVDLCALSGPIPVTIFLPVTR